MFSSRARLLGRVVGAVVVPTVPVLTWWKFARDERERIAEYVATKPRLPSQTTLDDLMVEKCRAGDIILFDRRWETCASGPLAALACIVNRLLLCDTTKPRTVDEGKFDHCGIIVPGYAETKAQELDPTNLMVLEATASEGIVARPLLTRLEMSQSRCILLVPIASSGELRYDENYEPKPSVVREHKYKDRALSDFRDKWVQLSKENNYSWIHSSTSLAGAIAYRLGATQAIAAPASPAAFLSLLGLQAAGVAALVDNAETRSTKVEDFLRDYRFNEVDTVRLRPGWKFLHPIILRGG